MASSLQNQKKQQLEVAEDRKHRDLIKSLVNETFLFETIVVDTRASFQHWLISSFVLTVWRLRTPSSQKEQRAPAVLFFQVLICTF